MKMSIIEALEKLAEINNYEEILVKIKDDEPTLIDLEIDDIRNFAEDPEEVFNLKVTEDTIRELDENGYIKSGEPLYIRRLFYVSRGVPVCDTIEYFPCYGFSIVSVLELDEIELNLRG